MTTQERDLWVAAPERWDEACFAVPAVRALMASGMGTGVLCRDEQRQFWQTLAGLEVLAFPTKAKAKAVAPAIRDGWQASPMWQPGLAAEAVKHAGVPRRLGAAGQPLKKLLTQPLGFAEKPLDHRVFTCGVTGHFDRTYSYAPCNPWSGTPL